VLNAADATTAEAVKVFEGVYRDVNIAIANQLALYANEMDIDVNEEIEIANTQPFCELHDLEPEVAATASLSTRTSSAGSSTPTPRY